MSEQPENQQSDDAQPRVVVVGPNGMAIEAAPGDDDERSLADLVEQPAKVMRIGGMIRQLLDEVRAAPLDEKARQRLKDIHEGALRQLRDGLAPELIEELETFSLPFGDDEVPTEGELRVAQAQLVGWLEGLFHGIQTALFAQQMAARAQLEQMRGRALPPGAGERHVIVGPGGQMIVPPGAQFGGREGDEHGGTGQYL